MQLYDLTKDWSVAGIKQRVDRYTLEECWIDFVRIIAPYTKSYERTAILWLFLEKQNQRNDTSTYPVVNWAYE